MTAAPVPSNSAALKCARSRQVSLDRASGVARQFLWNTNHCDLLAQAVLSSTFTNIDSLCTTCALSGGCWSRPVPAA
jgi:hypothetical protein